jgi:hypothetical protein
MATLNRITMPAIDASYQTATAGTSPAWAAGSGGGDKVPIGSGRGTLFGIRTTGTVSTVTLDSVRTSSYGTDVNVTITMGATDEKWVFLFNDGVGRFDAGGADAGLVNVSYSSVVGLTVAAVTIP